MSNFEVNAGNMRVYQTSEEERAKERERMDKMGNENPNLSFLLKESPPDYNGFFKVDQTYIDYLQASLDSSPKDKIDTNGAIRVNFKGYKVAKNDGTPQLNLQDLFAHGAGTFKKFRDGGEKPPEKKAAADTPPVDLEDDDLPF